MLLSSEEIAPFLRRPSFFSAHLGLNHVFTTSCKELCPWSYWPKMIQKPWQGTAQKISLAFILTALGGGRKTDGETVWETEGSSWERETKVERGGPSHRRGQEAAMAVPPPSLTIICWQSLQERRSPTFSRVRAASASSTARWPGEDRKERGRWRQASRMAVARSRWPGQVSTSPVGMRFM